MTILLRHGLTIATLSADTAERVVRRDEHNRLPPKIELLHDIVKPSTGFTSCEDLLVAFFDAVKYRDVAIVSEYVRKFAIDNMRLIMIVCNVDTDTFCRKLAMTPADVLKILLHCGDDGSYDWIPKSILFEMFFLLRELTKEDDWWNVSLGMTREETIKNLSAQFITYLYTMAPIGFSKRKPLATARGVTSYEIVSLLPSENLQCVKRHRASGSV